LAVAQLATNPTVFAYQAKLQAASRHRQLISDTVAEVVRGVMDKQQAIALVRRRAQEQLLQSEQARFIEVTETQRMSLHEGSTARYRLRPSDYQQTIDTHTQIPTELSVMSQGACAKKLQFSCGDQSDFLAS
jgi:hypothetical protein